MSLTWVNACERVQAAATKYGRLDDSNDHGFSQPRALRIQDQGARGPGSGGGLQPASPHCGPGGGEQVTAGSQPSSSKRERHHHYHHCRRPRPLSPLGWGEGFNAGPRTDGTHVQRIARIARCSRWSRASGAACARLVSAARFCLARTAAAGLGVRPPPCGGRALILLLCRSFSISNKTEGM